MRNLNLNIHYEFNDVLQKVYYTYKIHNTLGTLDTILDLTGKLISIFLIYIAFSLKKVSIKTKISVKVTNDGLLCLGVPQITSKSIIYISFLLICTEVDSFFNVPIDTRTQFYKKGFETHIYNWSIQNYILF